MHPKGILFFIFISIMGCKLSIPNNDSPMLDSEDTILLFKLKKMKEDGDDCSEIYYKLAPIIRDVLMNGKRKDVLYTCELLIELFGDKSLCWLKLSRKPASDIFKEI